MEAKFFFDNIPAESLSPRSTIRMTPRTFIGITRSMLNGTSSSLSIGNGKCRNTLATYKQHSLILAGVLKILTSSIKHLIVTLKNDPLPSPACPKPYEMSSIN